MKNERDCNTTKTTGIIPRQQLTRWRYRQPRKHAASYLFSILGGESNFNLTGENKSQKDLPTDLRAAIIFDLTHLEHRQYLQLDLKRICVNNYDGWICVFHSVVVAKLNF